MANHSVSPQSENGIIDGVGPNLHETEIPPSPPLLFEFFSSWARKGTNPVSKRRVVGCRPTNLATPPGRVGPANHLVFLFVRFME